EPVATLAPVVTTETYRLDRDEGHWAGFERRCQRATVTCFRDSDLVAQTSWKHGGCPPSRPRDHGRPVQRGLHTQHAMRSNRHALGRHSAGVLRTLALRRWLLVEP